MARFNYAENEILQYVDKYPETHKIHVKVLHDWVKKYSRREVSFESIKKYCRVLRNKSLIGWKMIDKKGHYKIWRAY